VVFLLGLLGILPGQGVLIVPQPHADRYTN
jgi:hypothetical protein